MRFRARFNIHSFASLRGNLSKLFVLLAVLACGMSAKAQYFPSFSGPIGDTNTQLGSAGAMVSWVPAGSVEPTLTVLFKQNNSNNGLFVASNSGSGFGSPTQVSGITIGAGPGATIFNGRIYASYQSNDGDYKLEVTQSLDGVTFSAPTYYSNIPIFGQPSMTVFNGVLYIAFRTTASGYIGIARSTDGITFTLTSYQPEGLATGSAPALAVFNNQLYMAFQQNNSNHNMYVSVSSDGQNFTTAEYTNIQFGGAPTMAVYNNTLLIAFQQNNSNRNLFLASSSNGSSWSLKEYSSTQMGTAGTMATITFYGASDNQLFLVYQQNNSDHNLFYNYADN